MYTSTLLKVHTVHLSKEPARRNQAFLYRNLPEEKQLFRRHQRVNFTELGSLPDNIRIKNSRIFCKYSALASLEPPFPPEPVYLLTQTPLPIKPVLRCTHPESLGQNLLQHLPTAPMMPKAYVGYQARYVRHWGTLKVRQQSFQKLPAHARISNRTNFFFIDKSAIAVFCGASISKYFALR